MKRAPLLVYLALLADVVAFFHKPLFSTQYTFPWDFHAVQLPLITFLADQLKQGRLALWNPFSYCGYPVFENIEACFFHPLVFLSALIGSRTSLDSLPMLLEWIVVLEIWFAGIAAWHLFQELGAGRPAAWAGAVIFQTGGYFASRAEHIGAIMAVAWMPLVWLAILKLRHGLRLNWLAALAAALGMAVFGGFPQPTLAVFISAVIVAVTLAALRLARIQLLAHDGGGLHSRHRARRHPVHPHRAIVAAQRRQVPRRLARHRRRALLAKPGLPGAAQSLRPIRHAPFSWPGRHHLSVSVLQYRGPLAGVDRAISAPDTVCRAVGNHVVGGPAMDAGR